MKSEDLSYIAGFLDGDGSIMATLESHSELKLKHRVRVMVKFSQHKKERGILEWIQKTIQMGYLSGSRNEIELVIKERDSLKWFLKLIAPYVKSKKTQLKLALEILKEYPIKTHEQLLKIAKMADAIGEANIRSRSRRKNKCEKLQLNHFNNPATTDPETHRIDEKRVR